MNPSDAAADDDDPPPPIDRARHSSSLSLRSSSFRAFSLSSSVLALVLASHTAL